MAVERKFVAEGARRARVEKHLVKELKRAGYGGMDLQRTPLGTQVTIYAEKPGIVIGKGGKVVRQLTQDLATDFGVESPQIEVQQVPNPSFNAQIMAERLANALERGWYFRKAGSSIIRRVMESGALGCEVIIAGKLTGARARVQKFTEGYIKHSGEPVNTIVEKGFAVAIKKLGVIGVQVRIIPPESKLPDHFEMIVPKQKLVRKEEIAITPVGEEIEEEDLAMDLDEFDDVETPEDR
ncbi:MAG TPA: 30S ribosomal protein S3 [Methanoregulaceae archaeon]|jgi:small subunit ribosomal protein S3|nr:MAG: 30S ribosomal protein S3 [Euryarchaeota archaeon ADurb.BinA087]HOB59742.1 30S ribosomal protein S3 [Methanoregulaceae archaeon]HOH80481.1 30S ribosomal protein S3 [Methanoregulaceae archaeon]HOW33773.1 30S ribosomal protein S3 [Methanoregulaceae archaeon]HPH34035.1 30S ribosomal protein S3 [Methanoregulaceae archaeon]